MLARMGLKQNTHILIVRILLSYSGTIYGGFSLCVLHNSQTELNICMHQDSVIQVLDNYTPQNR
jgi:hypothetical protein